MNAKENESTYDYFQKLDIRVGKILEVEDFPEARKPSYKLTIDFGEEVGIKRSSAQLVKHYKKSELKGKKVMGIVNLPPRQIGPFISEVLTLGVPDENHECVLIVPDKDNAVVGGRLY
ncbi:MAG TPA: tRNA-binding protein [Patescibacteria group bacterium]|nr:tRNA-binding protein [Patescibacteria group bacterium]